MARDTITPDTRSRPYGSVPDPKSRRNRQLQFCLFANTTAAKVQGNKWRSAATSVQNRPWVMQFHSCQSLARETRIARPVRHRFDPTPDTECMQTRNTPPGFQQPAAMPEGARSAAFCPEHCRRGRLQPRSCQGDQLPVLAQPEIPPQKAWRPVLSLQICANRAEPHRKPGDVA